MLNKNVYKKQIKTKKSIFGVFLVCIFPHSDWIQYLSVFSISPYSVRMLENRDQKNSEYGHFLRSGYSHFEVRNNVSWATIK